MLSDNILVAVVTTFDPDVHLIERLRLLTLQKTDVVILVDDSGCKKAELYMDQLLNLGVITIFNQTNSGIAAALNVGIKRAIELNADFILTLDDDSSLHVGYVDRLFSLFAVEPKSVICGVIDDYEPNYMQNIGLQYSVKRNLITSGCIYPAAVFDDVGFFDETFFIDLVDFEFCTRARAGGYKLLEVPAATMSHTIGKSKNIKMCRFDITIYNHNPFRIYYQIRNVYLYIYKYVFLEPFYCAYLLLNVSKTFLKIILFESNKLVRLSYFLKGTFHGLFNRGGRID